MPHNPAFERLTRRAKDKIQETSVAVVQEQLDQGVPLYFIDVREDHEYQKGYAKGAVHIGRGILERDIEDQVPDKNSLIILYCGGGYRSALAAANLLEMGYTQVRSMAGGFKAWKKAGYPISQVEP